MLVGKQSTSLGIEYRTEKEEARTQKVGGHQVSMKSKEKQKSGKERAGDVRSY